MSRRPERWLWIHWWWKHPAEGGNHLSVTMFGSEFLLTADRWLLTVYPLMLTAGSFTRKNHEGHRAKGG